MRSLYRRYAVVLSLILLMHAPASFAEKIASPFNGLELDLDEEPQGYCFFVGGHLYGSGNSIYPSPSMLLNIDRINSNESKFFIALGDIFHEPSPVKIETFISTLAGKLDMPFFNSVGNHDIWRNRRGYEDRFGKTYYHFIYRRELFIILDTQLDCGRISGEQLRYFLGVLDKGAADSEVENVFICTHNPIWYVANADYRRFFYYSDITNFSNDILPAVKKAAEKKKVYWLSDDIGGGEAPLHLFYDFDEYSNITYIATGIADTKNDTILKANVDKHGRVTFIPFSLTDQKLLSLESYDRAHWKYWVSLIYEHRLKAAIIRRFKNKFFISGFLAGAFFFFVMLMLYKVIAGNLRKRSR